MNVFILCCLAWQPPPHVTISNWEEKHLLFKGQLNNTEMQFLSHTGCVSRAHWPHGHQSGHSSTVTESSTGPRCPQNAPHVRGGDWCANTSLALMTALGLLLTWHHLPSLIPRFLALPLLTPETSQDCSGTHAVPKGRRGKGRFLKTSWMELKAALWSF